MDTSHREYVAEDLISHRLQDAGLLVAKPRNDRLGTDLLVFNEVNDGVKFCRVQCKGRSVASSDATVLVPADYVTNAFVLFLHVDSGPFTGSLYFFTPNDVRSWARTKKNEYRLRINRKKYVQILSPWLFGPQSIETIRSTIALAEAVGEFRRVTHGRQAMGTEDTPLALRVGTAVEKETALPLQQPTGDGTRNDALPVASAQLKR